MSETTTISAKSTAEQLDKWLITNYNPSDIGLAIEITGGTLYRPIIQPVRNKPSIEELEDEADVAIARQRLEEIRKNPSCLVSGEALRKALAELERK